MADHHDVTQPVDPPAPADPPKRPTRRERRAAGHGDPAARIAGLAASPLRQAPVRRRDYAARKRG